MNPTMNVCGKSLCGQSRYRRDAMRLLSSFVLLSAFGCGGQEPNPILDATALLERYEQVRQRHDPDHFSEVDLGEFTVTKRPQDEGTQTGQQKEVNLEKQREPALYFIRFKLFAVVSDKELAEFEELLVTHGERIRGKIRETVQSSELQQLEDPTLGWLKSELIQWINRSVNTPILRDVVFADFSFERG
ncbi:MAG: hypothetical protein ACYC3X_18170 [Pirellulaceae bacterium]